LGSSLAQGTKIEQFIAHSAVAAPYLEVRATRMETATRPASTNVQVAGLVHPNALIGVQLIAHAGGPPKEPIVVPGMPASPGKPFKPAPHAVVHGDFVFVTGQVSYDFDEGYPAAAEIDEDSWYQSKATAEARYIMGKIARILQHLGGSLDDCIKLEIYLNDLSDVVDLEKVMREAYGDDLPARSYIPTVRLGPTHCRVEVNAICRKPGAKGSIARIRGAEAERGSWLDPIATEHGGFLFTSSMAGNMSGRLDIALPLAEQITRVFEKLQQLAPLRGTGAESVLFASVQISTSVDLGELRWNFQQVKGQENIAISPVVVQAPLIWARGGVQADFICSIS
jgi:enamine deaminase RidA (YjgF/YER057c/UK114 family)